jgi:hypothetical protein
MRMAYLASVMVAALIGMAGTLSFLASPARAQDITNAKSAKAGELTDMSARRRTARRAPARITVFPRERTSIYPPTTPFAWPGPGAVRQCTAWLAQEIRPDGVFVVPRQRCWWEPAL